MHTVSRQFVVFALVGVLGTAAHFAVLIALVELAGMQPAWASACGAVAGAVINYVLNYRVTFASARPHAEAAPRFAAVATAGAALNTAIMYVSTQILGVQYVISQVLATGLVLIFNFVINRLWTFSTVAKQ